MAKCSVCNNSGANMKQCPKCKQIWCYSCASKGKGHYPKVSAGNVCPYCGSYKAETCKN